MEETFGLISDVECKFAKTEPDIIDALSNKTGKTPEMIRKIMRYNMFTVNQFSKLSGLTVSVIHNKIRPVLTDGKYGTELDFCYPFGDGDNEGPKFIIRNEKSEKILKS